MVTRDKTMARQKAGDKLTDIRLATVAEVVEVGSSAASINAIAKRAGLAVGTLYRYHANKDALLRSVYLAIKSDIHRALMTSTEDELTSGRKIRAMWFALLDYACQRPQDFLFTEVMMNAALLSSHEVDQVNAMSEDLLVIIRTAIADNTLRPGTVGAINTLLVAPAMQLARQSAVSGNALDKERAEEIFALCWRAVAV